MKKKLIAAGLGLCLLAGNMATALAENPKAEEYRQITAGGTYHIAYEIVPGWVSSANKGATSGWGYSYKGSAKNADVIAVDGNHRAVQFKYTYIDAGSTEKMLGFIRTYSVKNLIRNYYYWDGKYYQMIDKKEAKVATDAQLRNPNLNPQENWDNVKSRLRIPDALRMFVPLDKFGRHHGEIPVYTESGIAQGKKGEVPYDKYVMHEKSAAGTVLIENNYYVYYEAGKLPQIVHKIKYPGKEEINVESLIIREFDNTFPEKLKGLPKGCKVYRAGEGDLDDLLGNNVLVETISGGEAE